MAKKNNKKRPTKGHWLIKLALTIAGNKMWRDLDKKSKNCRKTQEEKLLDIIHYSKNTLYGKEHHFNQIKTIEDFQKQVPINEYEDLRPYIERQAKGEENVIVPGKPIFYGTTSGTTKKPKWIPITKKYNEECYGALSKLWFYSILKEHPNVFGGPDISIVGKAIEGYAEDGIPYGSFSGYVHDNIPKFLKAVHVIPGDVHKISDYFSRYYCIMRMTLEYEIKLIITGNPSTILEMHRSVQQHIDEIIEDIEKGTLKPDLKITEKQRQSIEELLDANPKRAAELRDLKNKHKVLYMKHYWPTLELVNTWKCGNSGLYLQNTNNFFPEKTKIREFSYLATEARAGIILKDNQMASIMACHLIFFEFIKEEDYNQENPRIYLANELEIGERYFILVTTPSGLFRYNMNDIMKMEGWYQQFPMLRFIQKGAGVTSLTGEKLYEQQYLEAIEKVKKQLGIHTHFHIGFADFNTSSYHIFAEFATELTAKEKKQFEKALDEKLAEYNIEYKSKRDSNRIKPLTVHALRERAFDHFKAACMAKGFRDGQFKLMHLMHDENRFAMFKELEREK